MMTTKTNLNLTVAALTDKGLSEKRPVNEDSFLADIARGIFAVADGVGGAQSGEVASNTAVETLLRAFEEHSPSDETADIEDLLELAIQRSNAAIYSMARAPGSAGMMATTIVAIHIGAKYVTVAHVGDSRLYRLSPDGKLSRETIDHSMVEEEVRAGRLTPEEAEAHPNRNIISRALGAEPSVEVDLETHEIYDGTLYLLCSDGITRHIPDDELHTLLASDLSLEAMCEEMKRRCYMRGAEDNLTAVLIQIGARRQMFSVVNNEIVTAELNGAETVAPVRTLTTTPLNLDDSNGSHTAAPPQVVQPLASSSSAELFGDTRNSSLISPLASASSSSPASPLPASSNTPRTNITINTEHDKPEAAFNTDATADATPPPRPARSSGALSKILLTLLVLGIVGAAFYVGMMYATRQQAQISNAPTPAPSAEPVAARVPMTYTQKVLAIDANPVQEFYDMTQAAQPDPLRSADPEFLYLYGRAQLKKGDTSGALSTFAQTVDRLKATRNLTAMPLLPAAQRALDAAGGALNQTTLPEAERAEEASKFLDEYIRLTMNNQATINTTNITTTPLPSNSNN